MMVILENNLTALVRCMRRRRLSVVPKHRSQDATEALEQRGDCGGSTSHDEHMPYPEPVTTSGFMKFLLFSGP